MAKNPYEYKSDSQLIMLALAWQNRKYNFDMPSAPKEWKDHQALLKELEKRGCEVRKASKFYPDEKIERRDNDK